MTKRFLKLKGRGRERAKHLRKSRNRSSNKVIRQLLKKSCSIK